MVKDRPQTDNTAIHGQNLFVEKINFFDFQSQKADLVRIGQVQRVGL